MPVLQIETKAGSPVQAGTRRLVPFSQVIRLNLPGMAAGGIIWNRPFSVLVQDEDGKDWNLPISDITRQAQIFLIGLGLFGAFLIWAARHRQSKTHP